MKHQNTFLSFLSLGLDSNQMSNLLEYVSTQTLQKSGMSLADRRELMSTLSEAIASGDVSSVRNKMYESGLQDRFNFNLDWLASDSGARFIQNDLPFLGKANLSGKIKSSVNWSRMASNQGNQLAGVLQQSLANSLRVANKEVMVNFVGGETADFMVQGLGQQTSRALEFQVSLPSMNTNFNLPILEESAAGLFAQTSNTTTKGFTRGEAIFVTPENFFTDFRYNDQTNKYSINYIGPDAERKTSAFVEFQVNQVSQLGRRIEEIQRNANLSPLVKQKRIEANINKYKQALEKNQFFVGNAGMLRGDATTAGLGNATQNALSKAAVMRQTGGPEISLSDQRFVKNPQVLLQVMSDTAQAHGKMIEFSLFSGQAGKSIGIMNSGYSPGIIRLPHTEPHKALSDITPTLSGSNLTHKGLVSKTVDLYRNADGSGLVNNSMSPVFNPVASRISASLLPTDINTRFAREGGTTELFLPDGTMIVSDKAFRNGMFDATYPDQYKIKGNGVGNVGPAQIGGTLRSLIEGGTVYTPGSDEGIEIPGLMKSLNEKGQGDFYSALGVSGVEEFNKKFTGGIAVQRGEFLGLDPTSGRSVRAFDAKNATESIVGLRQDGDNIALNIVRKVKAYEVNGQMVAPIIKGVGATLTKEGENIKLQTQQASNVQFARIAQTAYDMGIEKAGISGVEGFQISDRISNRVNTLMRSGIIKSPEMRLLHQAGALQFEMEEQYVEAGIMKTAGQEEKKAALKRLGSYSNEELLKKVASGNVLDDLGQIADLSNPQFAAAKNILKDQGRRSMDQRLAAVSAILFSDFGEKGQIKALSNIFAPYTQFGKIIGQAFGETTGNVKRYFDWGGKTEARTIEFAAAKGHNLGKQIRAEIDEVYSSTTAKGNESVGTKVIKSFNPMRFYTSFSIRDDTFTLSSGQRASIEPRFYDIAAMSPELRPVFKEITSRTTDMSKVTRQLQRTLTGIAPEGTEMMTLSGLLSKEGQRAMGKSSYIVDLGLSEDVIREANIAGGQVYVPGGKDISEMTIFSTGTGVEKDKPIRQVYNDYLRGIQKAKSMTNMDQVAEVSRLTTDFHSKLQKELKASFFGTPSGEGHGIMRAPVKGSAYLQFIGLEGDILDALGAIGKPSLANSAYDPSRRNQFVFSLAFQKRAGEEGIERQLIVSERAIKKMFGDAIEAAGSQSTKDNLLEQMNTLQKGGSVLAAASRHPAIGMRSMTAARIWMDTTSPAKSKEQYYAKGAQSFLEDFQLGIAEELSADFDGDRINLYAAGSEKAQAGLDQIMKQGNKHALRYQYIKDITKESFISNAASMADTSYLTSFSSAAVGAREEESIRRYTKQHLASALAHGAPDKIVPRISNTLTELKYAVAYSSKLGQGSKEQLASFLESVEQVPISSKHIAAHADYGLEVMNQLQRMQNAMFKDSTSRMEAADAMFNMFAKEEVVQAAQTKATGSQIEEAIRDVDYGAMKKNLITALDEMNENAHNQNVLGFLRKKTARMDLSTEELNDLLQFYGKRIQNIHGHDLDFNLTGTKVNQSSFARAAISGINEATETAAQTGKNNLPTKGIVGIAATVAAGLLVAGGASIALGPNITNTGSGGQYADPDMLFPDEMEPMNPQLHGGAIPTPVSGNLAHSGFRATMQLPAGSYSPTTLAGKMGTVMNNQFGGMSGRLHIQDDRSAIDAFTLATIKNEII